jgi:hypothetical protein
MFKFVVCYVSILCFFIKFIRNPFGIDRVEISQVLVTSKIGVTLTSEKCNPDLAYERTSPIIWLVSHSSKEDPEDLPG